MTEPLSPRPQRRVRRILVSASTTAVLLLGAAIPAWAAENMTVTFVRHAESEGNATGNTTDDNPPLTELGEQQARDSADRLAGNDYDAIYASDLIRTQQTAGPMADELGLPIHVEHGFRELEAGVLAGLPERVAGIGMLVVAANWMVGNRSAQIPGSIDGNEFDARMDGALKVVYDSGARNAVVYSHGGAIMFWVLMNVDNPDPMLLLEHPLSNTDTVVVEGNPEDGWTLVNWNGVEVAKDPALPTKLLVDVRDAVVVPQTAGYRVGQALQTGDLPTIAKAAQDGVEDVINAPVQLVKDVAEDMSDEFAKTEVAGIAEMPKSGGATDLRDGNKAAPGVVKALNRSSGKVRAAVGATREQVSSSVRSIKDAVKKATTKPSEKDAA
ncbi:histidine phosphatase family protein [Mycolicibacterium boenickei]|uniref:Histidine phosphatase family protein n=2 Tax=Mycolicibacterium boenickei TaxID=146017 RepID=A0AAX2ZV44_9MYCO|nr:histidine phosphatase family protein [Mycolicibacterium boenickei]PEG57108.1 phosphoglycerate mutase [Mycolicibacterium boenickei]UNB99179.1 histidine phosphatase family protein [Mycolicibacterium boenickei]